MLKRVIQAVGFLVAMSLAVILARAFTFSSATVQVEPASIPQFDEQALAGRLSRAIRFRTVSHRDPAEDDAEAFAGFRDFLEQEFPRVHMNLKRELVNEGGLLFT